MWKLRGRLIGLAVDAPLSKPLRLALHHQGSYDFRDAGLAIPVGADGSFDANVSAARSEDLTDLVLDADDPLYLPVRQVIPVADVQGGVPAEATFTAELDLVRAAIAVGRVLSPDSTPVAGADVFALAQDKAGELGPAEYAERSDAQGWFRLRVPRDGRYAVVATSGIGRDAEPAAAAVIRLRPAATIVTLRRGVEARVPDLVMRAGASLTGHVVGRCGEPMAHVKMRASRIAGDASEGDPLTARFEPAGSGAQTAADGAFCITGLVPGLYRLALSGHAVNAVRTTTGSEHEALTVRAPARDLELGTHLVALTLEVTAAGTTVSGAMIDVNGDGRPDGSTGADGTAHALVEPGAHLDWRVTRSGFAPAIATFDVPWEGPCPRVAVTLGRRQASGVLALRLWSAGEIVPARAWLLLTPGATGPALDRCVPVERGVVELDDLEPGRYQLRVRPGADAAGSSGFFAEESLEVEVPRSGRVEPTVPIRAAGRLDARAVDELGRGLPARACLRDHDGRLVPVRWTRRLGNAWDFSPDELWDAGNATADPPLPAGTYHLELSLGGYTSKKVSVTIADSSTAAIRIVMSEAGG
jgi:hypothetical protein